MHIYTYSQVIGHWSSPAPELKLLPAKIISVVEQIVQTSVLTPSQNTLICQHSEGLYNLLMHDNQVLETQQATPATLSPPLVKLLTVMLSKANAGLTGRNPVVTHPWSSDMPPFEDMIRTASYGPCHPVFRVLPYFAYDHNNKQQVIRYAKNRRGELEKMRSELSRQLMCMGATCNKHKTKEMLLTSGVFTIFCNRCAIIEYFELMCQPGSPATPARALFHRVWRSADAVALDSWLASGRTIFRDPV